MTVPMAEALLYLFIFMAGASIFSFLNVVIFRLPAKIPFTAGRSRCPSCGAQLRWYDMVPVLNWFYLRGKCRSCGGRISPRYPAVEALGGVCALLCVICRGYTAEAALDFAFLAILTVIAFIDWDTMEIPNGLVLAVLAAGVLSWIAGAGGLSPVQRLIGALCVSVPMFALTLAIPGAFGGGDIKLMAAAGLFLGWKLCLLSMFLAVLAGGIYGIYLLAAKKKDRREHFAFGPFLCAGMAAAIFWGEALLRWYLQLYM